MEVRNSTVSGRRKMSEKETYTEHSRMFPLYLPVFSYAFLIPFLITKLCRTQKKSEVLEVSGNGCSDTQKPLTPSTLESTDCLCGSL